MAAQTKEYTVQDEDKTYTLFMTPQDLSELTTKYIKLEDKDNIDLSKVNDFQITVHRNKKIFINRDGVLYEDETTKQTVDMVVQLSRQRRTSRISLHLIMVHTANQSLTTPKSSCCFDWRRKRLTQFKEFSIYLMAKRTQSWHSVADRFLSNQIQTRLPLTIKHQNMKRFW